MTAQINGVDITPYIAYGGWKWQRADVDGANAGRDLDGNLIRDRKAIKYRFDVTCIPLTAAQFADIQQLIEPVSFSVTFTDPMTNTVRTAQMYSNNYSANFQMITRQGVEYYAGFTFPLIMI